MRPVVCLLLFIAFMAASSSGLASTLTLGTFAGPPLSNSEQTGRYDRILNEAFGRIGHKIRIIHLPAERSLLNADSGITDGDFVRIAGLEAVYSNLVCVPEKIDDYEFVAFTRKFTIPTVSWESLQPYNVAIVRGWKILENNIRTLPPLVRTKNQDILFTLLDHDRADIVVYSRAEGLEVIRTLGLRNIRELTPPLAVREMYLYLNRKHASLVPALVQALRAMKLDGTFTSIAKQCLPQVNGQE